MKHGLYIFMLAVATLGFFFSQRSVAMAEHPVKIFSLQKPDGDLKQDLPELSDPLIYGVSWRFKWATIEPQEGQCNWEVIDKAIELTSNAGKKVMLRVVSGINTPEWVYQAGAKPFDFSNIDLAHPENFQKNMRMPVPWDEVYLSKWEKFIEAFGKRYNGNSHIYSIQMTGGGHIGEMNLPKAYQKWREIGYSDERIITVWKQIIDAYRKAFPDIPTNLDINEPLGRKSDVLGPVASYVVSTYPGKVYLQQNGLREDISRNDRIRKIIREASVKTIVGYQMLGGRGFLEKQTGNRLAAFRNAMEDHVSYVEVYASDVRDPTMKSALQSLSAMKGR